MEYTYQNSIRPITFTLGICEISLLSERKQSIRNSDRYNIKPERGPDPFLDHTIIKPFVVADPVASKLCRKMGRPNTRNLTMTRKAMMKKGASPSHQRINMCPTSWHRYRFCKGVRTPRPPRRETTKALSLIMGCAVACYGRARHAKRRPSQWTAEKQLL
jgi:hypothetical protein